MTGNRDFLNFEFGKLKIRASGRLAVIALLFLGAALLLRVSGLYVWW